MPLRIAVICISALLAVPAAAAAQSARTVADPAGGDRWTARASKSGARTCVTVLRGTARFGRVCERISSRRVFSYNTLTEQQPDPRASRTVFVASFHRSVVRARMATPDGTVTYRRGRGPRIMVAVLAGLVERPPLRVEVRRKRRTRIVRSATPSGVQVADPLGGPAWRTGTQTGTDGASCVRWERIPPRFEAPPSPAQGESRCGGPSGAVPVASAEVVDGRLVVVGKASSSVRTLTLTGVGDPRTLTIDTGSRTFLAVLPGDVDPGSLRLTVTTTAGGTTDRAIDVA